MQNFSVMAEIRKGFARRGSSELGRRGFARVPNIDAEGLRMETEITRDRYFCTDLIRPTAFETFQTISRCQRSRAACRHSATSSS